MTIGVFMFETISYTFLEIDLATKVIILPAYIYKMLKNYFVSNDLSS